MTTTTSVGGAAAGGKRDSSAAVSDGTLKKGPWTAAEDAILLEYVKKHGEGNWNAVQRNSGLARCGKSCRLRWANHLRPNLKKGSFSPEEELLIIRLHSQHGNKWARMAAQLPGRTDNEIKNYWNTRIKRRLKAGLPVYPPEVQREMQKAAAEAKSNSNSQNSPGATPPTTPSSASSDFSALFSPMSASRFKISAVGNPFVGRTTPPLNTPELQPRFQMFSSPGAAPPPGASLLRYNFQNYCLNPAMSAVPPSDAAAAQFLQPASPHPATYSMKMELPSTQVFFDQPIGSLQNNNSGLLEALVMDSQSHRDLKPLHTSPPLASEELKLVLSPVLDHHFNKLDELLDNSFGIELKEEQPDVADALCNDISMTTTATTGIPDWFNCDSQDISITTGSSGLPITADINDGLDMHHFFVKPEEHDWKTLASCPWDNMSIC